MWGDSARVMMMSVEKIRFARETGSWGAGGREIALVHGICAHGDANEIENDETAGHRGHSSALRAETA